MEAQFVTSNPIYFTVGALLIFCFTSSVFLLYDYTVERRQRKVMSTAVRTNAIVASLFPSVVRDRIYPTEQGGNDTKAFNLANSKARLKSFLSDGTSHGDGTDVGSEPRPTNTSAPIAELFPEYVARQRVSYQAILLTTISPLDAIRSLSDTAALFCSQTLWGLQHGRQSETLRRFSCCSKPFTAPSTR